MRLSWSTRIPACAANFSTSLLWFAFAFWYSNQSGCGKKEKSKALLGSHQSCITVKYCFPLLMILLITVLHSHFSKRSALPFECSWNEVSVRPLSSRVFEIRALCYCFIKSCFLIASSVLLPSPEFPSVVYIFMVMRCQGLFAVFKAQPCSHQRLIVPRLLLPISIELG